MAVPWFCGVMRLSHLLDRAVMELSVGVETTRYGDYRPVEGLMLPFRISVERRDQNETGIAAIRNYLRSWCAQWQRFRTLP